MKDRNLIIAVGAVVILVSLIMNFQLLSRVDELENQVNFVTADQQQILNEVNNQTSSIQSVMNDFKEQNSWISDIFMDFDTEKLEDGQAEAIFEWQIKELHNDSEVVFNYSFGESEEFKKIPAKELDTGVYEVNVPFTFDAEPIWEIIFMSSGSGQETVTEEAKSDPYEEYNLNYFVSVTYDDTVKNSEIRTENLGEFGSSVYGFLQVDVNEYKGKYSVMLMNHAGRDENLVEEAYVLKYQDGKLIKEEMMEAENEEDPYSTFMNLKNVETVDDMTLAVKVVYSNGDTFEKEIY